LALLECNQGVPDDVYLLGSHFSEFDVGFDKLNFASCTVRIKIIKSGAAR
jgi:hypothetical protein